MPLRCDKPLRADPVRRDEVIRSRLQFLTMPIGTYRCEVRPWHTFTRPDGSSHTLTSKYVIGDPALWHPLLDELAAEIEATRRRCEQRLRDEPCPAGWDEARWVNYIMGPVQKLPKPEFFADGDRVQEYVCEVCGARYIGLTRRHNRQRYAVCSNRCDDARINAVKRQYRRDNPPTAEVHNAARAQHRAAARAGRTCEHCGVPIEAARATKRYCSDICRVRAYRGKPSSISAIVEKPDVVKLRRPARRGIIMARPTR